MKAMNKLRSKCFLKSVTLIFIFHVTYLMFIERIVPFTNLSSRTKDNLFFAIFIINMYFHKTFQIYIMNNITAYVDRKIWRKILLIFTIADARNLVQAYSLNMGISPMHYWKFSSNSAILLKCLYFTMLLYHFYLWVDFLLFGMILTTLTAVPFIQRALLFVLILASDFPLS